MLPSHSNLLEKIWNAFDTEPVNAKAATINHLEYHIWHLKDRKVPIYDKLFCFKPAKQSNGQSNAKILDAENGSVMSIWTSSSSYVDIESDPNIVGNFCLAVGVHGLDEKSNKYFLTHYGSQNFHKGKKNSQWSIDVGDTTIYHGFSTKSSVDFEIEFPGKMSIARSGTDHKWSKVS